MADVQDTPQDPGAAPASGATAETEVLAPASAAPAPAVPEPVPAAIPAPTPAASHTAAPVESRQVVYVQAPTPPVPRSNRGIGSLVALLGAVGFALVYLAAGALIIALTPGANVQAGVAQFTVSAVFWVPIAVYAVFAVLFVLAVNRAAWWVHVLGSLAVACVVYAASIGILALGSNVVVMTQGQALELFARLASNPFLIAVLLLARESALWFGLAIAARGRRLVARNAQDRAEYEETVAARRAEYERAHPAA